MIPPLRRRALGSSLALLSAAAMAAALILLSAHHAALTPKDFFHLAVDVYKSFFVGAAVALVGTLLPLMFRDARESFEQLKTARLAYSEAKTGLDYLHLMLSSMALRETIEFLHRVHLQKHVAELYPELAMILQDGKSGALPPTQRVREWSEKRFHTLVAARLTLEECADRWDAMTRSARRAELRARAPSDVRYAADSEVEAAQARAQ